MSLRWPGHIFTLRSVDGGVLERNGHTEASVGLVKLAGLTPIAELSEIVGEEGGMIRLAGLIESGAREGVLVITIEALISYLQEHEITLVSDVSAAQRSAW